VRGEGVRQAEHRGELGAEQAGAQNPDRDVEAFARDRANPPRLGRLEIVHQLDDVVGELVGVGGEVASKRSGGGLVGARRPAETEVDSTRMESGEGAELFGDLKRRPVGQHDPARADADRRGRFGDISEADSGRGAGDPRHRMMLGHPEAVVAQALDVAGEVRGIAERLTGVAPLDDRRQVED